MRYLLLLALVGYGVAERRGAADCTCDPARVSDVTSPVPEKGELMIWHRPDDGKVRLLYRDPVNGIVAVQFIEE